MLVIGEVIEPGTLCLHRETRVGIGIGHPSRGTQLFTVSPEAEPLEQSSEMDRLSVR